MSGLAANLSKLVVPLFQDHPHLYKYSNARVTEVGKGNFRGKDYHWIMLNETIFHPHGGGQLSDKGTINKLTVDYVHKEKLHETDLNLVEILHCFEKPIDFKAGQVVEMEVDPDNRYLNSLWHTAAHFIDYIIVKNYPHLVGHSGQCYPNQAFMKFTSENPEGPYPAEKEVKEVVARHFQKLVKEKPTLEIVRENNIRKLKIADHPIPCGGTHIHSVEELGNLEVSSAKFEKKEGKYRVSFIISGFDPKGYVKELKV